VKSLPAPIPPGEPLLVDICGERGKPRRSTPYLEYAVTRRGEILHVGAEVHFHDPDKHSLAHTHSHVSDLLSDVVQHVEEAHHHSGTSQFRDTLNCRILRILCITYHKHDPR
jgi:hypothetical protein